MNIFLVLYGNGEFVVDIVSVHRMKESASLAAFKVTESIDSRRSSLGMVRLKWTRAELAGMARWAEIGGLWVEVRSFRVVS